MGNTSPVVRTFNVSTVRFLEQMSIISWQRVDETPGGRRFEMVYPSGEQL